MQFYTSSTTMIANLKKGHFTRVIFKFNSGNALAFKSKFSQSGICGSRIDFSPSQYPIDNKKCKNQKCKYQVSIECKVPKRLKAGCICLSNIG